MGLFYPTDGTSTSFGPTRAESCNVTTRCSGRHCSISSLDLHNIITVSPTSVAFTIRKRNHGMDMSGVENHKSTSCPAWLKVSLGRLPFQSPCLLMCHRYHCILLSGVWGQSFRFRGYFVGCLLCRPKSVSCQVLLICGMQQHACLQPQCRYRWCGSGATCWCSLARCLTHGAARWPPCAPQDIIAHRPLPLWGAEVLRNLHVHVLRRVQLQ